MDAAIPAEGIQTTVMINKIAVVYSSKHGHVRAIAERLGELAALRRVDCVLVDVRTAARRSLLDCDAAVVAGSVHFGRHARALRRFVQRSLAWLSTVPTAFVSVSGSAAALDGDVEAETYLAEFLRATGWQPDMTLSAAGAVLYTKYDPITRLLMKFASRTSGRDNDTSRDYVYTNWTLVDQFMHQFLDILERREKVRLQA